MVAMLCIAHRARQNRRLVQFGTDELIAHRCGGIEDDVYGRAGLSNSGLCKYRPESSVKLMKRSLTILQGGTKVASGACAVHSNPG